MADFTTPTVGSQSSQDEITKAARKRGRAYRCLRCFHREGRNFIEVKCRLEAHILRDHLRRDEVPHYCSLCQFRCTRREELEDHVVKYKRHRVLAQQSGVDPEDTSCLKSNPSPYRIDEKDFSVLDRESSFRHWKEMLESRRTRDPLARAVNQIFPGGLPDLDFQDEDDEEPLPQDNNAAPQTVVSLDGNMLKATLTPLLDKLSTIVDPQILKNLLGEPEKGDTGKMDTTEQTGIQADDQREEENREERTDVNSEKEPANVEKETVVEKDGETMQGTMTVAAEGEAEVEKKDGEEENLMPQLLPKEDQALTPKRKLSGIIIPNKRMRPASPSSSDSSYLSSDDDDEREEKQELVKEIRKMGEAIQRNTRVLQSLEQTMLTLASAMTAAAKESRKVAEGQDEKAKKSTTTQTLSQPKDNKERDNHTRTSSRSDTNKRREDRREERRETNQATKRSRSDDRDRHHRHYRR